jgi:hypothetical protein
MRKLVCLLAVALMAAPVLAGSVAVTVDDSTAGQAVITLTGDAGIVGIGLEVSCTAGAIDDLAVDSFFDIFIDLAHDEVAGDGYAYGEGSEAGANAAAEVAVAGKKDLPAAEFAICAGGLEDSETDTAPTTATVTLISAAGATGTVDINIPRGGIVDADGAMTVTGLPANFTIQPSGPACWNHPCFTSGDANNDGFITFLDLQAVIDAWGGYDECADFNKDGFVTFLDLQVILDSWGNPCP